MVKFQHPQYPDGKNKISVNQGNITKFFDFALLQLEHPVPLSQTVNLVCLPTEHEDENLNDTPSTASGWGTISSNVKKISPVVSSTTLKVLSPKNCAKYWKKENQKWIVENPIQICALQPNYTTGPCAGDSGGKFEKSQCLIFMYKISQAQDLA